MVFTEYSPLSSAAELVRRLLQPIDARCGSIRKRSARGKRCVASRSIWRRSTIQSMCLNTRFASGLLPAGVRPAVAQGRGASANGSLR